MVKNIALFMALIGVIAFTPLCASGKSHIVNIEESSDTITNPPPQKTKTEVLPDGSTKITTWVYIPEMKQYVKGSELIQKNSQSLTRSTTTTTNKTHKKH